MSGAEDKSAADIHRRTGRWPTEYIKKYNNYFLAPKIIESGSTRMIEIYIQELLSKLQYLQTPT